MKRLLSLGLTADERGALYSPLESLVVDAEMFAGPTRASEATAMRRHGETMKRHKRE